MPSQKYFNRLFSFYAPFYPLISRLFNRSRKQQINRVFQYMEAERPDVLLIGAGDGVDIPFFSKYNSLVYLDAAPRMVKKAKKKYGKFRHISFEEKEIAHFEPKARFDVICLHFCLSVTSDPRKMIQKAYEMVKPNGIISILDVSDYPKNNARTVINEFTKRSMFDLQINISKTMELFGPNLQLVEKRPLKETSLFSSYVYQNKKSNENGL